MYEPFFMKALLMPILLGYDRYGFGTLPPGRMAIYVVVSALGMIIRCPITVVTTRLLIQRNHLPRDCDSIPQEGHWQADNSGAVYSGAEEDVVRCARIPWNLSPLTNANAAFGAKEILTMGFPTAYGA